MSVANIARLQPAALKRQAARMVPGVLIAVVIGISAQFLSDHYGAPAMLMALLLVADALADLSRWALLVAIAAVGMKTSLRRIRDVGGDAILLIVAETLFIAVLILAGVTAFNL